MAAGATEPKIELAGGRKKSLWMINGDLYLVRTDLFIISST